jgi:hydroxymethylglutaryl-CoA reductase (NADPH)
MSVREFSSMFSWGFSFRRSNWLVPLFNNNIFTFGNTAVNGPYGRTRRFKTTQAKKDPIDTNQQTRETHSVAFKSEKKTVDLVQDLAADLAAVQKRVTEAAIKKQQQTVLNKEPEMKEGTEKSKEVKDIKEMSDGEVLDLLLTGRLQQYKLEDKLGDKERAVRIRRMFFAANIDTQKNVLENLPYKHFDYDKVFGRCCENVVGYIQLPVGIVGPLKLDGEDVYVPMATCEGCLVASTQRGAKALSSGKGVTSVILADGMTRGPVVQVPNAKRSGELKAWVTENFNEIAKEFNSTSRFARLSEIKVAVAGRKCFLRFKCFTGDAMGMNMISKAVSKAVEFITKHNPDCEVLALSGNYCTDKKPSAINWIEGRGKSVVCDAIVPKEVVEKQLKTTVDKIVELSTSKNLIGSAMAGSIGGMNAHASNLVTAVFLATGQDAAQNVESSNCMTLMEKTEEGDLYISCSMPSIEVGTVGGGTHLDAQASCLDVIGVKGASQNKPGENAQKLAKVVCATVMAGELSLMSALATNDLVNSHMKLNRGK